MHGHAWPWGGCLFRHQLANPSASTKDVSGASMPVFLALMFPDALKTTSADQFCLCLLDGFYCRPRSLRTKPCSCTFLSAQNKNDCSHQLWKTVLIIATPNRPKCLHLPQHLSSDFTPLLSPSIGSVEGPMHHCQLSADRAISLRQQDTALVLSWYSALNT